MQSRFFLFVWVALFDFFSLYEEKLVVEHQMFKGKKKVLKVPSQVLH